MVLMRGRSSKGDVAQSALRLVEQAIGEPLKPHRKMVHFPPRKKNPAAVALGKLGGMKGQSKSREADIGRTQGKVVGYFDCS